METDKYLLEILNRLASDITELKSSVRDISKTQTDHDKKIMILELCKEKVKEFNTQFSEIVERVEEVESSSRHHSSKLRELFKKNYLVIKCLVFLLVFEILISYHTNTLEPIFNRLKDLAKAIF